MNQFSNLNIQSDTLFSALAPAASIQEHLSGKARELESVRRLMTEWTQANEVCFINLAENTDHQAILSLGQSIREKFQQIIVFGIGGSSLGGEMLVNTLGRAADKSRISFYDNVDPATLAPLYNIDWSTTQLIVISKSGNTAETLSQFLTVLPAMEKQLGADGAKNHTIAITENKEGALYQVASELGIKIIEHPSVGGRFSVLSVVGLLPAAIAGVDILSVVKGAIAMRDRCLENALEDNPALVNGLAQFLAATNGYSHSVLMPYADNLRMVVNWFRQLWAESLGKKDRDGNPTGLSPIAAHGVTDQHSQLQLYLDGPQDKQFTFLISQDAINNGAIVPNRFAEIAAIKPLTEHSMGQLFMAEMKATRTTLARNGCPIRSIYMPDNDATALGELIMLMELETIVVAHLFGIDPFDQPAVEESKVLAREYLANPAILC